jgi:RNA polymerase sigma-70 factor (ECF subfamily)
MLLAQQMDARVFPTPAASASDEMDDAALVARAARSDRDAFEVLYQRHAGPLYRTAFGLTRDHHVAEELLQEAFVRAYRNMARVQLDRGASLRPWLHRILINLAYDWSARQRSARSLVERSGIHLLPQALSSPEHHAESVETKRAVLDAVDQLPFKQRTVVVLFYLQEMDLAEIAETLDLPPGTVKSRLHYGRERLRELLTGERQAAAGLEVSHAQA